MKILGIEVDNLGPLHGVHTIDLEGDLAEASLFAIVGPTGAGKSTITDAIVLALFGVTPRLSRGRGEDHLDPIQLMSRGTGSMRATVRFRLQTPSGTDEYRASYQQQRARKRPDGTPGAVRRILERRSGDAWVTLVASEKRKEYEPVFEAALDGMTSVDFYRSVLLAQGDFAAFLRMPPTERAAMLERITRSLDFARIGKQAKTRFAELRDALASLELRAGDVARVSPDERIRLEHRLVAIREAIVRASDERARAAARVAAEEAVAAATARVGEATSRHAGGLDALTARWGDSAALEAHRRTARVLPIAASVERDEGLANALAAEQAKLGPEVASLASVAEHARREASDAHERLAAGEAGAALERESILELERQAERSHALRSAASQATQRREAAAQALARLRGLRGDRTSALLGLAERVDAAVREADAVANALVRHLGVGSNDTEGLGAARDVRALRVELEARERRHDERLRALEGMSTALERVGAADEESQRLDLPRLTELVASAEDASRSAHALIEALEGEERSLDGHRQRLARIAALDEHRRTLEPGVPCALCGAVEHPVLTDASRANEFAEARDELHRLEAAVTTVRAKLGKARSGTVEAERRLADARARRDSGRDAAKVQAGVLAAERERVAAAARALGLAETSTLHEVRANQHHATLALGAAREARAAFDALEAQARHAESARAEAERLHGLARNSLTALDDELVRAEAASASVQEDEFTCLAAAAAEEHAFELALGGTSIETRLRHMNETLHELRSRRDTTEKRAAASSRAHAEAQTRLAELERRLAELASRLTDELRPELARALVSSGFDDLASCRAASLDAAHATALEAELDRLEADLNVARGALDQASSVLVAARERLASAPWTEVETPAAVVADRDERLGELAEEKGGIDGSLEAHRKAEAHYADLAGQIAATQREAAIWERLHKLIGVNDGQRFRTFAQTLNLTGLLVLANDELGRLSRRYRLVPVPHAVDFVIADAFHADERRPLSTLSGGETFLVSLSLSLGLARYSASRRPIETLLLDEGFGTLDPETLEVAMQALESLRARGTQVGVITHVEALKERIPARIVVEALGQGRSRVRIDAGRQPP